MADEIEYIVWIWLRSWEDTLTAAGYTIEQAHEWLDKRLKMWGI